MYYGNEILLRILRKTALRNITEFSGPDHPPCLKPSCLAHGKIGMVTNGEVHLLVDIVEVCFAPQNGAQLHAGGFEVCDGRLAVELKRAAQDPRYHLFADKKSCEHHARREDALELVEQRRIDGGEEHHRVGTADRSPPPRPLNSLP